MRQRADLGFLFTVFVTVFAPFKKQTLTRFLGFSFPGSHLGLDFVRKNPWRVAEKHNEHGSILALRT
jgi:hypothetical protein